MFSIYGIAGPVFSGTLEQMNRVRALTRARSVRAIAEEGDEPDIEAVATRPREEAVRAYREMLHGDLECGPLYHAGQIMPRRVITVSDGDAVTRAWRTLRDRHIYQASVFDDGNRLVGFVSRSDVLRAVVIDPPLSLWR